MGEGDDGKVQGEMSCDGKARPSIRERDGSSRQVLAPICRRPLCLRYEEENERNS